MKKVHFSAYWRPGNRHPERVLSVLPLVDRIDLAELDTLIATRLATMAPLGRVHFVGTDSRLRSIASALADAESPLYARLVRSMRKSPEEDDRAVSLISFDTANGDFRLASFKNRVYSDSGTLAEERRRTLRDAFATSGSEEHAPPGAHFAKTSGFHSDRFLRVSRVFEDTANAHLAAFWLLPHLWREMPSQIVVDTSSLHPLALMAATHLLQEGKISQLPLIWSHNSHSGVAQLPPDVIEKGFFLISASTSGGLQRRLRERGVPPSRILTCFELLPDSGGSPQSSILCDLRKDDFGGIEPIKSVSAESCQFCRDGSQVIRIEGDQFSLSPPEISLVEILARDLEPAARSMLSMLAGRGAFRLYRRDSFESRLVRDIWIDANEALFAQFAKKATGLEQRLAAWKHSISQAMTLDVSTVIASDYAGSDYLANLSLSSYTWRSSSVRGITHREIAALPPEPGGATVVLAGAIDREDEFLSISRAMRSFQPGGATYYLSMFSAFPTPKDRETFSTNITFGTHGRQTFRFDSIFDLYLEVDRHGGTWRREVDTLQRMISWADRTGVEVPLAIEQRITFLQRAVATGVVNGALWPSPSGTALKLRSDFTLLDWSLEPPEVTEADLYVLWSVILNSLRHRRDARCLQQSTYHKALVAPKNFDRYSDGILQACILRASRPAELAYGNSGDAVSAAMRNFLLDMLVNGLDDLRAEALNEFLVALASGNMTLQSSHLTSVLDVVVAKADATRHEGTLFLARALAKHAEWGEEKRS